MDKPTLLDDWKELNALINVAEKKKVNAQAVTKMRQALNRLYEAATSKEVRK